MKQKTVQTLWSVGLVAALAAVMLAGCGGEAASSAQADNGTSGTYTSSVLDTSYADALSLNDQLALGTIQLEETDQAVTPEQATALLPLWQALRGGVTDQIEVNAVLKQIEGTMSQEQLQAIAAMQLTQESLQTWMQEQGPPGGFAGGPGFGDMSDEERAALQATAQAGGGFGGFGNMTDEERAALQATREAGGGFQGGFSGFGNMTDEERAALRETAQAGGGTGFGGMSEEQRAALQATIEAGGGASRQAGGWRGSGGGSGSALVEPLIQLLQERAGGA